ncbi:envelope integrity protein Cei [Gordonia pseudamarae]|uniref:Envelope integrity protein Cei n=1 Tax=Gordonia pseudamarae TaxID=2831662 RepID=A0ABX6IIN4_9ACTN|nr:MULTISPECIES: envelope integrity protein Cei [Gordonia]MBD0020888.1 envelope integrity protein Cei [Gordonia sp. (in: high G+C Gram-positive bacteria)]QHN26248.1 envelope integrity protein Cei [Gordonia pseudamarae]QHN35140.1 envelope integrity protein Cei [Gordonia pseudamarae]
MVSQIAAGSTTDRKGRPYRRRRSEPVLITVTVLAVLALVVWCIAAVKSGDDPTPTACPAPLPAPPAASAPADTTTPTSTTLTVVDNEEMKTIAPAALSGFQVRVLNSSGQRGAARSVSDDLTAQGFTPATDTPYADDEVYVGQDLDCVAQIRFGPGSKNAAAAVWLAIPCAQLVDDGRRDVVVDVALGTHYESRELSQDAQAALEALRLANPKDPATGADPGLVSAVHKQSC